jgi:hypothetical protein
LQIHLISGVAFDETFTNPELLALCRRHAPPEKKYVVEDIVMAEGRGISLLRLPPYHPELNPIELVWGNIKVNINSIISSVVSYPFNCYCYFIGISKCT